MLTQMLLSIALLSTEWIIGILLLLSVWSVAIIIERVLVFRARGGDGDDLEANIKILLQKGKMAEARELLRTSKRSAARVVLRVVDSMKNGGLSFEDGLSIAITEEKLELDRRTAILGTLGSNAPYIGLLGTVLGIVHAFHNLSQHIQGGPSVILQGISEALVATALGLFIAIPAVVAYNYFSRCIRKILVHAENVARALAPSLVK
ncbi:MAG: MotA/TolQ/ExbB proton channel family protein [Candidatus Omnitrophica bacterium]|nr:MotA/TolQ/ExbB proton channel family protein [Candidatus Omnitrophota bacterium]